MQTAYTGHMKHIFSFLVIVACMSGTVYAWTGPTAVPPNNNVAAPVNVGGSNQTKPGLIGANIFNVYGSNQYINFGTTTGATGFGFRNNGGIIEYKQTAGHNTAAAWTEVGKGRGSYVRIALNYCGGGCGSYHALSTWVNVSSYGYTWTTYTNTDTPTFTPNGTGTVTINKAGVYRIRLQTMMIPAANTAWVAYGCPVINGSANCGPLGAGEGLKHAYYPAGWWGQNITEFTFDLAAGTTVGYGYYIHSGVSYWAHDTYTFLDILRLN
jgi:hypothetical protein